jgi:hypothetical protein
MYLRYYDTSPYNLRAVNKRVEFDTILAGLWYGLRSRYAASFHAIKSMRCSQYEVKNVVIFCQYTNKRFH